jgi:hypothetical protein
MEERLEREETQGSRRWAGLVSRCGTSQPEQEGVSFAITEREFFGNPFG